MAVHSRSDLIDVTYIHLSLTHSLPSLPPPSLFLSPYVWLGTFVTFAFFCNNLSIFSVATAARRAAKRSPILIMRKKREPMGGFSHSYHARGLVRTTTEATATESRNMAAKPQIYETCSLGLPYTLFATSFPGSFPKLGKRHWERDWLYWLIVFLDCISSVSKVIDHGHGRGRRLGSPTHLFVPKKDIHLKGCAFLLLSWAVFYKGRPISISS